MLKKVWETSLLSKRNKLLLEFDLEKSTFCEQGYLDFEAVSLNIIFPFRKFNVF